jgi:hypothetical protein
MSHRILSGLALALACLVPTASHGDAFTSKGPIGRFKTTQAGPAGSADFECTSSFAFVAIPGASVTFTLSEPARVVLMFQGQFGDFTSTDNARVVLSISVDGAIAGAAVAIGSDPGTGLQTFGFNSVSHLLGAGQHTAQVSWHTFPEGTTMCVEERSLIVLMP